MQALSLRIIGAKYSRDAGYDLKWCKAVCLLAAITETVAGMFFVMATDKIAPKGNAPFITMGLLP